MWSCLNLDKESPSSNSWLNFRQTRHYFEFVSHNRSELPPRVPRGVLMVKIRSGMDQKLCLDQLPIICQFAPSLMIVRVEYCGRLSRSAPSNVCAPVEFVTSSAVALRFLIVNFVPLFKVTALGIVFVRLLPLNSITVSIADAV